MRIVINCRSILLKNRTGIGRYAYHLLDELGIIDERNDYVLYAKLNLFDVKRKLPSFKKLRFIQNLNRFGLPPDKADVYHVPSPAIIEPFKGKVVVTVHDLIHRTYPQSHPQETIDLTEQAMQNIVGRADRIICVSENTRLDLHRFYDVPKEKSCVVLNGVDHGIFFPVNNHQELQATLTQHGIPPRFLLFVGTIEPRKNLMGLLEAVAQLKEQIPLVVVGMKGWMMEDIDPKVNGLGLKGRIIFTGFIKDQDLNHLYNACTAFIFPSFYEGFGFPILEAFAAGACVVSSSTPSCAEIAQNAGVLIDPNQPALMAQAIDQLLGDEALRSAIKAKGLRRAQDFSFAKTAGQTLDVYQSFDRKT